MPRVRRAAVERRHSYMGDNWTAFLLSNIGRIEVLIHDVPYELMDDEQAYNEAIREAWDIRGEELLAKWIVEHPGTRPRIWWLLEASEPLRQIGIEKRSPEFIERVRHTSGSKMAEMYAREEKPVMETERDYLSRLNLLTDDERRQLENDNARHN